MYSQIYTIITDKLAALGLTNIGSGLADPPPLPCWQVYLHDDQTVDDSPYERRTVTFVVKFSAMVPASGDAGALHAAMDLVRSGFSGWLPETVAAGMVKPFSVPSVALHEFRENGHSAYVILIRSVFLPAKFQTL